MAPQPKRKHSSKRGRVRRDVLLLRKTAALTPCANCKKLILPHRVCQYCGYYKGRQIISIAKQRKKKNEETK